jgi:hypothetical protein
MNLEMIHPKTKLDYIQSKKQSTREKVSQLSRKKKRNQSSLSRKVRNEFDRMNSEIYAVARGEYKPTKKEWPYMHKSVGEASKNQHGESAKFAWDDVAKEDLVSEDEVECDRKEDGLGDGLRLGLDRKGDEEMGLMGDYRRREVGGAGSAGRPVGRDHTKGHARRDGGDVSELRLGSAKSFFDGSNDDRMSFKLSRKTSQFSTFEEAGTGESLTVENHTFEEFWRITCSVYGKWAITSFYMGTLFFLISQIIYLYSFFLDHYHSFVSAVVSACIIGVAMIVGVCFTAYMRYQSRRDKRTKGY